jgi:hypothetical protein
MSQTVRSNSPDAPECIPSKSFKDDDFVPTDSPRPMGRLPLRSALQQAGMGTKPPPDETSE